MGKVIIPNYNFVRSWSDDQLDEFVNIPHGLPNRLLDIVREVIPDINSRRLEASIDHPEFEHMDQEQSIIPRRLVREDKLDEAFEHEIQYTLDFLEKYPQYKPMIKEVKNISFGKLRKLFHV
ncbi:hypothetical protein [Methanobrevibacter sp.]|uniref:hypothetical protein n=1 Tax=Methanobrevibacter sp. TaxID=66852 RepID=UPI00388FF840